MIQSIRIPDQELRIAATRSGGPGGQNVNKVASKVQLRWCVGAASVFSLEDKERIRRALAHRLNDADEIMIDVDEERSQAQNRETAGRRLRELVARALIPIKKRRPTRPTRSSQEKRITEKKKMGKKKQGRKLGAENDDISLQIGN